MSILAKSKSYDIISVQETWLSADFDSTLLFCPDYHIYRTDRNDHGGGVLTLVRKTFSSILVRSISVFGCDLCITDINLDIEFRLINVYRPPNISINDSRSLFMFLSQFFNVNYKVVLVGDINIEYESTPRVQISSILRDFMVSHDLCLQVSSPTHPATDPKKIIDVVLSAPGIVKSCVTGPPFSSTCDHLSVCFSLFLVDIGDDNIDIRVPDYFGANYDAVCAHLLSLDWSNFHAPSTEIQEKCDIFCANIHQAVRTCIPMKKRGNFSKIPAHLLRSESRKNASWKAFLRGAPFSLY